MKKIRLLAILLAMLMIQFGMLFSCTDEEEPEEEEEEEEEEGGSGSSGTGSILSAGNKVVADGTRFGYLAYFDFDYADNGNLGVIKAPDKPTDPNYNKYSDLKLVDPYSTYFDGALVTGGAYTVKPHSASGKYGKYLSIQKTNGNITAPYLDLKVKVEGTVFDSGANDFQNQHIIEFDLEFSKGLFGTPVSFASCNESSRQTLFRIEDNIMYDCNGNAIYGEKSTDKEGWVSVALVIDGSAKKYDIYIDMVKQTDGVAFSNQGYPDFLMRRPDSYRFAIEAGYDADSYIRVDNIAIRNGSESYLGTILGYDIIPTYYDYATFKYSFLDPSWNAILTPVEKQSITSGEYNEKLIFKSGNAEFTFTASAASTAQNGDITYDPDGAGSTEAISGTYNISASGSRKMMIFNWGSNAAPQISSADIVAGEYADKVLSLYSDAACTTKIGEFAFADSVLNKLAAAKAAVLKNPFVDNKFTTGFDPVWYENNKINLSKFKFGFYATEAAVNNNISFAIRFNVPSNKVGEEIYAEFVFSKGNKTETTQYGATYQKGLNEYTLGADEIADLSTVDTNAFNFEKVVSISVHYDAAANNNTVLYFTELGYDVNNIAIKVEGPNEEKPNCTHKDHISTPYFKPLPDMVSGGCQSGSYYMQKCSQCGATKLDMSKPLGYMQPHNYSAENIIEAPSCYRHGREYRKCLDCGIEETIRVIETEGHDSVLIRVDGNTAYYACRLCGVETTKTIHTEVMSFQEKMLQLGFSDNQRNNLSTSSDANKRINITDDQRITDDGGFKATLSLGWASFTVKALNGTTVKTVDTDTSTMLKFTGGSAGTETYLDFIPSGNGKQPFFNAASFVFEFDIMLGKPADPTKSREEQVWLRNDYLTFGGGWRGGKIKYCDSDDPDKSVPEATLGMLRLSKYGYFVLSDFDEEKNINVDGHTQFWLDPEKTYNIAMYFNLAKNTLELYIDGEKIDECQFLRNVEDSLIFSPTHIRPFFGNGLSNGAEMYFDSFLFYESEHGPLCQIDKSIPGISDYKGEVNLQDRLLNDVKPSFNVFANSSAFDFNIPIDLNLNNFVLELALNSEKALGNGTIMSVTKSGYGLKYTEDLITVKDKKLYVMGMLVSDTVNVKLALSFDSNTNQIIVYVNGERIPGVVALDDGFADKTTVVRTFTMHAECGSYSVSGLKLYTGTDIQK